MTIEEQLKYFKDGFPWMKIDSAATPGRGIEVLSVEDQDKCIEYASTAKVAGKVKFVPASGAASRMFKDIFAGMQTPNASVKRLTETSENSRSTILPFSERPMPALTKIALILHRLCSWMADWAMAANQKGY